MAPQNLQRCPACGEEASGPDAKSVAAAMSRHQQKKHSKQVKR